MEYNGKRIEELQEIVDRVTSTKDSSISFLQDAGILDSTGQLSHLYR